MADANNRLRSVLVSAYSKDHRAVLAAALRKHSYFVVSLESLDALLDASQASPNAVVVIVDDDPLHSAIWTARFIRTTGRLGENHQEASPIVVVTTMSEAIDRDDVSTLEVIRCKGSLDPIPVSDVVETVLGLSTTHAQH